MRTSSEGESQMLKLRKRWEFGKRLPGKDYGDWESFAERPRRTPMPILGAPPVDEILDKWAMAGIEPPATLGATQAEASGPSPGRAPSRADSRATRRRRQTRGAWTAGTSVAVP